MVNMYAVAIRKPAGGGSMFYKYKYYSMMLLAALADANYELIWVDIGSNGAAKILRYDTLTDTVISVKKQTILSIFSLSVQTLNHFGKM